MSKPADYKVHIAFDEEAARWYVSESDIPGLCLEAPSPAELIRKVTDAAPELIELNLPRTRRGKSKRTAAVRPVFDDPVELAHA